MTKDEEMLRKTFLDQGKLGERPFTKASSDWTRRNGFNLKQNKFRKRIVYCEGR